MTMTEEDKIGITVDLTFLAIAQGTDTTVGAWPVGTGCLPTVFCFLTLEALCSLEARTQIGLARLPSGGVPLPSSLHPFTASLRCPHVLFCGHFVSLTVTACLSKLCICAHNLFDVSYPLTISMLV